MKTIGFLISKKENEKRRALIPNGLVNVRNISYLYFEKGYGEILGYSDEDYHKMGVNIVNRERIFKQDIICNIHAPEPIEQTLFYKGKIFYGMSLSLKVNLKM